jgi:uncharacterized sporulation protein YeaH/YhbH (DUF444 family)
MHIVDRRLNPGGKSLENRQRFLRRAKSLVRQAVRKATEGRDIKDVMKGGAVGIPLDGMNEPRFGRSGGVRDMVLPGNTKYVEGDFIPRQGGGGGGRSSKPGEGDGDDAFRFVLTREEFVDLFLDDLELPDLAKRQIAETESDGLRRAGYSVSGSPANISISRTVGRAMARRIALRRPSPEAIAKLEFEIAECDDADRRGALVEELDSLRSKVRRIPFIDPIDIRYRRFENVPKPVAKAVMFCLMDVSGSMTEHMKDLAKRFYMLLYVFLTRRYKRVDIVFIRHTDKAEEVDEQTFFYGPASGGTQVSSALAAMRDIVKARYSPSEWNIYAAQASDGDNSYSDGDAVAALLKDAILPVTQYFAYLEVGENRVGYDMNDYQTDSTLWTLYGRLIAAGASMSMRRVVDRTEIFPVFRELFARRQQERQTS